MFAAPQYFQAILKADAFGSGLRLLPMIGGIVVGAVLADRLTPRLGIKVVVSLGFALLIGGLLLGATTKVTSGEGLAAAWIAIAGAGVGFSLPKAMDAALGALSPERSGVGSALLQAVRMVGGAFGAAILGSIMNSAYHNALHLGSLPASAAAAVRDSVFGGLAVAQELGSAALAESVRSAFMHGIAVMLVACAGVALVGLVLTLAYLPRTAAIAEVEEVSGTTEEGEGVELQGEFIA
jgi:Na+/melibiose symporter-like transporter